MMLYYLNFIEPQLKRKKHIVITGSIGSGKSTLLKRLKVKLCLTDSTPGLITWNVPCQAVYMRKLGDDEPAQIGQFNPNSYSIRNRMKVVPEGFNIYGVSALESFINDDSEWVTIDEIGFLERDCQPYLDKLTELFGKKRIIAVVRKQDIKHINDIINREDALVLDLDADSNYDYVNKHSYAPKFNKGN